VLFRSRDELSSERGVNCGTVWGAGAEGRVAGDAVVRVDVAMGTTVVVGETLVGVGRLNGWNGFREGVGRGRTKFGNSVLPTDLSTTVVAGLKG